MTKSDIFAQILSVTSEVCNVSEDKILSKSKPDDVVEARCIFIYHCNQYGIPASAIANFLNRKTQRFANYYLRNYPTFKKSYYFRAMSKEVGEKLCKIFEETV